MFFKPSPPICPVCHNYMDKVDLLAVPKEAVREFARLNKWRMMSKGGWFLCSGCNLHIHVPTVSSLGK